MAERGRVMATVEAFKKWLKEREVKAVRF